MAPSSTATRWKPMALVGAGAALGALARWSVAELMPHAVDGFPWATLIVNLAGCIAIGIAARRLAPATSVWFAGVTGLLGGFTTFSTFANEVRALVAADRLSLAITYVAITVGGGLVGVELGRAAAR